MRKYAVFTLLFLSLLLYLSGCNNAQPAAPSDTPTPNMTQTTEAVINIVNIIGTYYATQTAVAQATQTSVALSWTPTGTATPTFTATVTSTASVSPTTTVTPSFTTVFTSTLSPTCTVTPTLTPCYCEDKDLDGWPVGNCCLGGPQDTNDNDDTIYPGAPELCDNKDNDGDMQVDEDVAAGPACYACCTDGWYSGHMACQGGMMVCQPEVPLGVDCSSTPPSFTPTYTRTATATPTSTQVCGIAAGNKNDDDNGSTQSYNYGIFASPFIAAAGAHADRIDVKFDVPSNCAAAIYTDNGGKPGTVVAQGKTNNPIGPGWISISLGGEALATGTKYWLAVCQEDFSVRIQQDFMTSYGTKAAVFDFYTAYGQGMPDNLPSWVAFDEVELKAAVMQCP